MKKNNSKIHQVSDIPNDDAVVVANIVANVVNGVKCEADICVCS